MRIIKIFYNLKIKAAIEKTRKTAMENLAAANQLGIDAWKIWPDEVPMNTPYGPKIKEYLNTAEKHFEKIRKLRAENGDKND